MSSSEIKNVIAILCKQLNLLFDAGLHPEYFRLAKFNKNEENIVARLWNVLSLFFNKKNKLTPNEIKHNMKKLQYTCASFYKLPDDMSSGSRELLLAIAYILNRHLEDFICDAIDNSPFGDHYDILGINSGNYAYNNSVSSVPNDLKFEKENREFVKWISGKISQNEAIFVEYSKQSDKIYNKLNNSLNFKTNQNLTKNEIVSLCDSRYCQKFLDEITFIFQILETYSNWLKKERIFWKWMVSVLTEKYKCV